MTHETYGAELDVCVFFFFILVENTHTAAWDEIISKGINCHFPSGESINR